MNLNQLEYFQKVCQFKNITKAADYLHISQPSITNAIKNLENELGVTLLNRTNKKINITDEGKLFLERANNILDEINNAVEEMKDYNVNKKEVLKIGIPPMIGTFLFPKIFVGFSKLHPNIELKIYENGSEETKLMVEKNELNLAIVILDSTDHLYSNLILKSEIHICMSKNHCLSKKQSVSIKDTEKEPIIMLKEGFYHNKVIKECFNKYNIKPNIILYSNQLDTIKSFVKNNIGITFLLKEIAKTEKEIVHKPFQNPINVSIGLVWKRNKYLSKKVKHFINYINNNI